jgi:hypothetical protein
LFASWRNKPSRATINISESVPDKSENMENAFQSEFACELGCALKDIDQHFKSEFATDLQSSLVIVNNKESGDNLGDEEEKLNDDSHYSNLAEDQQLDQVK